MKLFNWSFIASLPYLLINVLNSKLYQAMFKIKVIYWMQLKNNSIAQDGALKVLSIYSQMWTMENRNKFKYIYFLYRDISCFDDVSNWLHDNGLIIGDICMAIAGVLLLIIIFTCCLCFHPEKKMQAGNFYQRMAYYD